MVCQKRIAVITGATSGVGKAISIYLLKKGVDVIALGRKRDKILDLLEPVSGSVKNGQITFLKTDFSEEAAIIGTLEKIRQNEKIDFLIHCAAVHHLSGFEKSNIIDLDHSWQVNVRAPFMITQRLITQLTHANGMVVFLNSSVTERVAGSDVIQYAMTKSALRTMAEYLRPELNKMNIRVISMILGKTDTPMQKEICEVKELPYKPEKMLNPDNVAELIYQVLQQPENVEVTDVYMRPSEPYS